MKVRYNLKHFINATIQHAIKTKYIVNTKIIYIGRYVNEKNMRVENAASIIYIHIE